MEERIQNDMESIKKVFRHFDYKQDKTIPREKLLQVLLKLDPTFERQALQNLFELSDVASADDVKYEEFVDFVRPPIDETSKGKKDDAPGSPGSPRPKAKKSSSFRKQKSSGSKPNSPGSDSGFGEEEEVEQQKIKQQQERPRRISISAKAITDDEVKDYQKPVYPKSEAEKKSLADSITENPKMQVLCGHLGKEAMDDILNAFSESEFSDSTDIITQGAKGECLYILQEGSVDIFVARPGPDGKVPPGEKGSKVCTWTAGALFGELALMYDAPRAATVTAAGQVKTWVLQAIDFKMLLMKSANSQYQKYEGWLSQVKLLDSLNHFELSQIADMMESDCFDAGEDIIVQGEAGDKFFFLEDGTAAAYIQGDQGEVEVKKYETIGDYFGEIALLTQEPRRASVRATGEGCSVSYVKAEDFTAVLGPIADKLKQDIDNYPQYAKFLEAGYVEAKTG